MPDEWIKWDGRNGGSPLFAEHDAVAVRTRGGAETGYELRPWEFSGWRHTNSPNDILEYRLEPLPGSAVSAEQAAAFLKNQSAQVLHLRAGDDGTAA